MTRVPEQHQKEPLIAITDGPMAPQWFWASDWHALRRAAQDMADRGQTPDRCLAYRETSKDVPHRANPAWIGRAWTYAPEEANG
jgi:hypothetical protein